MRISQAQSEFLNHSRWIAAWLVVLEHARSLIFQDYAREGVEHAAWAVRLAAKGFYFMTGFGHEAVMVFFVLSGYLVGGRAWEQIREGSFTWRRFLCDRVSRLYAVLIFALLAGWVLDSCGSSWFNASGLYNLTMGEPVAVISRPVIADLTFATFLGNLLFTQTILVNPFGSNGPLWSLANEWWYYLLFPAAMAIFWSKSNAARLLAIIATGAIVCFLTVPILALFGVWVLGVACAALSRRLFPLWITLPLLLVTFFVARIEIIKVPYLDQYLMGIAFALLLNSFAGSVQRLPGAHVGRFLADFSYTTYLLHFPWLVFFAAVVQSAMSQHSRLPFGPMPLGIFSVAVASAFLLSWLVSLLTEARTKTYREWLYRVFCTQERTLNQ